MKKRKHELLRYESHTTERNSKKYDLYRGIYYYH